jgi:hypothetical protein
LKTIHNVRFVTDNAGIVAFDLPELMGRETWFTVTSDGYQVPADGFGRRGVKLTPTPGGKLTIEVTRTSIAKRLGRLTGAGQFAESQKLGQEASWSETGVLGCDSIQNAVHRGKLFWIWGDTNLPGYPLGIFDASAATSSTQPLSTFESPVRLRLKYFTDEHGRPYGVAPMPGDGPTWLSGLSSLPDKSGAPRLVAAYMKIKPPLEGYECGLCVWNDDREKFEHFRTVWTKSTSTLKHPPMPQGHAVITAGDGGQKTVLYGNPLPELSCPATFEAWQDPAQWKTLTRQKEFPTPDGKRIQAASGSITWNAYRKRWVTVFMQAFGKPSGFGEIWYAEADAPSGPWGPAVKVLSHENYTFYNPRLHPEFTPADSPVLLFEGTYTDTFANRPEPTPRYDYNQILYRLDLDDPKLAPARKKQR